MITRLSGVGYFFTILIVSASLLCFCSSINIAGGLETTNGVRIVVRADGIIGTATPGSQIILCDTSYCSPQLSPELFISTLFVDSTGKFNISSLQNGCYNLIARSRSSEMGGIIYNIKINNSSKLKLVDSADYINLGSISGLVMIDSKIQPYCLVYTKGVAMWDSTDSNGFYNISEIPMGNFKLEAYFKIKKTPGIDIYYTSIDSVKVDEPETNVKINLNLELLK